MIRSQAFSTLRISPRVRTPLSTPSSFAQDSGGAPGRYRVGQAVAHESTRAKCDTDSRAKTAASRKLGGLSHT